ncbi:hypothetical protein WMF31_19925 [Sorangium sp. So ce1036]|uniref:hypothetical protein n=1 Tax=Sorangium sp. So ce1036 TaxID=3133328 RepID=UPI003EFD5680
MPVLGAAGNPSPPLPPTLGSPPAHGFTTAAPPATVSAEHASPPYIPSGPSGALLGPGKSSP